MSDLSKRITALSPEKLTLLAGQLKKKGVNTLRKEIIPRRSKTNFCSLSFAQERLWFIDQLNPGNCVYNNLAAIRLTGSLNCTALYQSLNEILRRHEILRTTFSIINGQLVQVISPNQPFSLKEVDLRALPKIEREAEVLRLTTAESQHPFDLTKGPLLQATLLQVFDMEYVLLLNMHHIISDAWSTAVLIREIAVLYENFCTGKPSPLSELPIQYADFAVWQREWLQGEVLEKQLAYWKQQLNGVPHVLELPMVQPRPAIQSFKGARQSLVLPTSLSESLRALSHQEGSTLFMTLLAAFQTLLYRYTNQENIIVGTPIANRNQAETEGLIGFFVNTLVLCTNFSGNPCFRKLLSQVRKVTLEAYDHQDLPFEKLVEALKPERDQSRNPLFQVMFALDNISIPTLQPTGLTLDFLEVNNKTAKRDLTLLVSETKEELTALVEYNTDIFDKNTITQMLGHYQTLLEGIVATPEQKVSALPLLTEAERHQLLVEWNNTQRNYPNNVLVHQLFEAQAEQTPDAVAVVFEDEQLTYQELNCRANQLGHYLQKVGVKPEVLVGICIERSLDMLVGLLGILKAGGVYVPLDPTFPKDRLTYILQDINCSLLVTQKYLLMQLPEHKARVICLDTDWKISAQESKDNLTTQLTADNLAYIVYTSGSTGKPKGVTVEHKQLMNYVNGILDRVEITPGANNFAMVQPLTVDSCLSVVFPSLCTSGCLHVLSQKLIYDSRAIGDYFYLHHIDCLKIAPSHLAALQISSSNPEKILPNHWLLLGGESLSWAWAQRFQLLAPNCTIFNHYGPTETTVGVLTNRLEKDLVNKPASTVPIGRPIPNTQIYLLDSHLQPVPVGVPADLYVSGASLTRAYLNKPDLTAEKFIPNPFSEEAGTRLYKTGDLACYLPDGNIKFLGRLDHQVKIRGYRIELGEIEAVVRQHLSVKEVAVLVREDAAGDKRLVAYVVTKREMYTDNSLRSFLEQKLPNYMIPSAFVNLESLPVTPHGKLDYKALQNSTDICLKLTGDYVAPTSEVERTIAAIWQEVLNVEKVGIHDNFFDLGGHSLLVVEIHTKLQNVFNKDISIMELFKYPNISSLSKYLKQEQDEQNSLQKSHSRAQNRANSINKQKDFRQNSRVTKRL
ncbi:amino acid adenylation domain-containing protein [Scytonema sp. UIC 10036]|uniref:non-ribosomal peptide synthetase n=1 Tax=Scytonema sp. UIC 10036 TaxID=2304196 RepID=UPI0012DA5357|nr:non-ribosomal peptide synthetase [Scytonema sp. UIC 10036]MUG92154.1 amino acid adenylation domain-containing protein [Scytonema sp. UIC 10036]